MTPKQLILTVSLIMPPLVTGAAAGFYAGLTLAAAFMALELAACTLVRKSRKHFPWLITPIDAYPKLDPEALDKFVEFGFDPELGWERKPLTSKTETGKNGVPVSFHINEYGGRVNPGHEALPKGEIAIYGDSFGFSRQVNDDESLQWHLSELLQTNVWNFAVGNYGLDQALLRFRRLHRDFPAKVTIFALVPSTIVRIHDMWKHYNEFGNIYGFKPRFELDGQGRLRLAPNPVTGREEFLQYPRFLPYVQKHDLFYKRKFLNEILRFPYLTHVCAQPLRNFSLLRLIAHEKLKRKELRDRKSPYPLPMQTIMRVNLALRRDLFLEAGPLSLLKALTLRMAEECRERGSRPVLLWMPQKDDIRHILKKNDCFYASYIEWAGEKLTCIDMTPVLLKENTDLLYCDDTDYGGHFTCAANKLVAGYIVNSTGF